MLNFVTYCPILKQLFLNLKAISLYYILSKWSTFFIIRNHIWIKRDMFFRIYWCITGTVGLENWCTQACQVWFITGDRWTQKKDHIICSVFLHLAQGMICTRHFFIYPKQWSDTYVPIFNTSNETSQIFIREHKRWNVKGVSSFSTKLEMHKAFLYLSQTMKRHISFHI